MMISVPSGQQRRWFEAENAWLAIDTEASVSPVAICTLEDAVLLDDHDPLLQCIANWCGTDFDWTPATAEKFDQLAVTLKSRTGRTLTAGLGMSEQLLESLPPFPEHFAELVSVGWHQTEAALLLDKVEMSAADISRLQPGSLLLLPGSYAEVWQSELIFDQPDRRAANVFVQPATGMLSFGAWQAASDSVDTSSLNCDVFLETPMLIDLNEWLGVTESGSAMASTDGFFRRSLRIVAGNREFTAKLMVIGDGYGALIDPHA